MLSKESKITIVHLSLLFLVSFAIRLVYLWIFEYKELEFKVGHDEYVNLAQHWLGWRTAQNDTTLFQPGPVYSFICYLVFKITNSDLLLPIRLLNVLFSSLSSVFITILGSKLIDEKSGFVSGLFSTICPGLVFFSVPLQSESFFILISLIFFIFMYSIKINEFWKWILLGFIGGILSLTRGIFLIYLPFLLITSLGNLSKNNKLPKLLITSFWLIPIVLWGTRNYLLYHEFIPITVQAGNMLYDGLTSNNEDRIERMKKKWETNKTLGLTTHLKQDRYYMNVALNYVKNNIYTYSKTIIKKAFKFWRPFPYPPYPESFIYLIGSFYCVLFFLSIVGLNYLYMDYEKLMPIIIYFFAITITHSILDTSLRYRIPLEPFLCIFSSVGIIKIIKDKTIL